MQLGGAYPVREVSRLGGRERPVATAAWHFGTGTGCLLRGGLAAGRPGGGAPGGLEHGREFVSRRYLAIVDIDSQLHCWISRNHILQFGDYTNRQA